LDGFHVVEEDGDLVLAAREEGESVGKGKGGRRKTNAVRQRCSRDWFSRLSHSVLLTALLGDEQTGSISKVEKGRRKEENVRLEFGLKARVVFCADGGGTGRRGVLESDLKFPVRSRRKKKVSTGERRKKRRKEERTC
jgi:hypothetical protein